MNIDRGCYCPGETILIDANVDNQTPRELTALKAKLVQRIDYNASRKTKVVHSTIAKLEGKTTIIFQFVKTLVFSCGFHC